MTTAVGSQEVPEFAYIYGLRDPRIPDVIWYVGKTNNIRTRLQEYLKNSCPQSRSSVPVRRWILQLLAEGIKPEIVELEKVPFSEWKDRERAAIALYRKKNLLLLNKLDGGNGTDVKGKKQFCDKCGTKRIQLYPSDSTRRCPICRKQQRKEYEAAWGKANSAHLKQHRAQYYRNNLEVISEKQNAYNAAHKEEIRQQKRQRYEERRQAGLCRRNPCSLFAVSGKASCEKHLQEARDYWTNVGNQRRLAA